MKNSTLHDDDDVEDVSRLFPRERKMPDDLYDAFANRKIGQCSICGESLTIDHKCGPLYEKTTDQKTFTREQVDELWGYAHHDSWRCNYYGKCHCGLDDLCKQMGLELHPMKEA